MKKIVLLTTFIITLTASFAQKGIKESCAVTTPPEIDGKVDEWTSEWMLDPDGKFLYNVCNDETSLYIRLKVTDVLTQRKIGVFGLTLWLDPLGKKKSKLGLRYPMGIHYDGEKEKEQLPKQENAKRGELEKSFLRDVEVLELLGLAKDPIVSSRLGLMNGIQVVIVATDDAAYLYEAKIPFKSYRLKKSEIKNLSVGFETGHFVPNVKNQSSNSGMQGGGAGMGNYNQGSYNGPRSEMMTPTKLWVSIKLN